MLSKREKGKNIYIVSNQYSCAFILLQQSPFLVSLARLFEGIQGMYPFKNQRRLCRARIECIPSKTKEGCAEHVSFLWFYVVKLQASKGKQKYAKLVFFPSHRKQLLSFLLYVNLLNQQEILQEGIRAYFQRRRLRQKYANLVFFSSHRIHC